MQSGGEPELAIALSALEEVLPADVHEDVGVDGLERRRKVEHPSALFLKRALIG